jgi:hypothetical protein
MSSAWLPCSRAKCARSRVYKLVRRGSSFPGLEDGVRSYLGLTLITFALLSLL